MGLRSMLFNKPNQRKKAKKKHTVSQDKLQDTSGQASDLPKQNLDKSLQINLDTIKQTTGNSADIVIREIEIGKNGSIKAAIIVTDGLIDDKIVNEFILTTLLSSNFDSSQQSISQIINDIEKKILPITGVSTVKDWQLLFHKLLTGEAIILIDGEPIAIATTTQGGEKRSISEPQSELSLYGPRESFTESLRVNTSLIRRRIINANLWTESFKIGKVAQTDVSIMYIKGIANEEIVQEVKDRLQKISIDQVLDSGMIEQLIEDETYSTFPTTFHSERPDTVTSNLMEGRIAIFVNGSPYVITVPALFIEFFQAVDDYYSRFDISIFLRMLRVFIFFISMILPSAYVAVTTYHQEMVPTLLIIAIAAQREAVPFPAYVEALIMEFTFEILREAGVRLPRPVGQAVSIVGALVIGQAAIQANIVSPAMVIIVSVTAIANFAIPSFAMAISTRLLRFGLMTLAAVMGFYGVIFGLMIILLHLCDLRSFGIPYLAPFAPMMNKNLGDTVVRLPLYKMETRPKLISQKNIYRAKHVQKPGPPDNKS